VKFLCDRCKTRYSIGDERVRGKILKIRCKNCANVITVREGMTDEGLSGPERQRGRPTTAAPMSVAASAPAGSALASAFVSQGSKPPPALEEEWYVSIDGEQSGPFSLAQAQRWIASKPPGADLHCWSEGFDDWLPVDKVSHFRGLRKKPPTTPPPLPAPTRGVPRAEDPKPLFAATMASLERGPAPAGLAPIQPAPTLKGPAVGSSGIAAKANGSGSAPVPKVGESGAVPKLSAKAAAPPIPSVAKSGPARGLGSPASSGARALADAFDNDGEPMTAVDRNPFTEAAEPAATKRGPEPQLHKPADETDEPDADDSLEIGEVSRVVNLADLAKSPRPARQTRQPLAGRATGSAPRIGGMTGPVQRIDGAPFAPGAPLGDGAVADLGAAPVVAQAHRRGLIMLIGVAALLIIGVVVGVVFVFNRDDGETGGGLGHGREIDMSRPEEVVRAHMIAPQAGSGAGTPFKQPGHRIMTPGTHNTGGDMAEMDPKGTKIRPDEIEDMAQKQSQGTQRCYMRAQRGATGIEVQDLKKLTVTLVIDKTGGVTDVQFAEKTADMLLACLRGQIKGWHFRESPGGSYRIVLAFAAG
jgi:predicted Zn finger-like uncharacterized protein